MTSSASSYPRKKEGGARGVEALLDKMLVPSNNLPFHRHSFFRSFFFGGGGVARLLVE